MPLSPPPEILRNTATLEAWRAYQRKANAPLVLAVLPSSILTSLTPAMMAATRHSHTYALPLDITLVAAEVAALTWLIIVAFKVRAYKRTHPFVPPPPVVWGDKRGRAGRG